MIASRRRISIYLAAAIVAGVGASCRRPGTGGSSGGATAPVNPPWLGQAPPADRGGIATDERLYRCLGGNPNTLNPILMSSAPEKRVGELLFDSPFIYDDELEWRTSDVMVASCTDSPDHRETTLTLKKGLRWHDGQPLTAYDVEYAWRKIMDDRVPVVAARTGTDQIVACTALDDWTVRFTHREPLPTNKWNMAFDVLPKHVYEQGEADDPTMVTSEYNARMNRAPIGNGPYRFVEWVTDDKIVLERWDDYPGPKPFFKRVVFRIIPDAQSRLLAFERQEIDETQLTPQQFALETDGQSFAGVGIKGTAPRWQFYYIAWNQDGSNPFFSDRSVRRAMCYATNYPLIIQQVFHGLFAQSYGAYYDLRTRYGVKADPFRFDLAEAAKLLDDAGWLKDAQDGWRYKTVEQNGAPTRTRLAFVIKIPQESQTASMITAIMEQDLAAIGVQLKSHVIEWATLLSQVRSHDFQATLSTFTLGVDPDQAWNLWHSDAYDNGRNYGKYANPRVDELFERGRRTFERDQRMQCYAEISRLVYEDAPYTFLVDAANLWAFNRRLRGVRFTPRGPDLFYPGARNWWVPADLALHADAGP